MKQVLLNAHRGVLLADHLPIYRGKLAGIRTAAQAGGLTQTIWALRRRGLLDHDDYLTAAGRQAVEQLNTTQKP